MTIAIGLATRECVVLAADSAVTHGRAVVWKTSSVGETSDAVKGIEEGALKLVPIGSHAAAAMAGTANHAVNALAWFRPHVQADDFLAAWAAAMSVIEDVDFVVLVARWHRGEPEIYRCAGREAERVRPGQAVVIGSATNDERATFETRTRTLLVHGNEPQMIQVGICALLVWRALNEVSFRDNIGGTPASLLVDANGTTWMPDTSAYVVDVRPDSNGVLQLHEQIHRLSIIGRDSIVAVASTYTNATRLLVNPMMSEQMPEWVEKHGDEVLRVARSNAVTLVALVALIQKRLAVLELGLCQGKYIDVQPDRLVLGDELRSFFLAPPPLLPGGAVFSIPLGEPRALAMIDTGGPVDQYDVDLGASFMLDACVAQKDFDSAERVWRSMLSRFPYNPTVLTSGLVALEFEPGFPRLDAVLTAWEEAIPADPTLIEQAQFVATQHPAHPDVAARLTRAVALAKPA